MNNIKPILVTGSHRSGSTWAGKMLAAAPNTGYIYEPFNVGLEHHTIRAQLPNLYQYICDENCAQFEHLITQAINYDYPLLYNLARIKNTKGLAKILQHQALSLIYKIKGSTPIIKDPIALFSAVWLSKTFNMNVLVMIRHPAAFCSSLKIKGWQFNFRELLNQPLLMEKYLGGFSDQLKCAADKETSIINQAILLWNCIHHTINIYRKNNLDWLFIRHEDLSSNPSQQFQYIYEKLGLEFTSRAQSIILNQSGPHNPYEQKPGNEFVRDSRANIHNWKNRLEANEIKKIRTETAAVSQLFYSDVDW